MFVKKSEKILIVCVLVLIFVCSLYLSTFAGYKDFGLHLFKKAFCLNGDTDSILLEVLRFPRVLKAVIAGACLATSGMFMQAVSKNPLAEPYITGISSGAGLGIVISIMFFSGINYALFGFSGALIAAFLVIFFCGLSKLSVTKLILVGLSVNMFVSSIISFVILKNPDKAYSMMYILSGGVTENGGLSDLAITLLFVCAMICAAVLIPKLNFLRLESSFLPNMKKQQDFYTVLMIVVSAFLAAVSVLSAGILGFVGIIAPQISKKIIGRDYRWVFFVNILLGSILILISDLIARCVIYPLQIPLGLVVALIGSPIFVYFLLRKGALLND